jgi:hypothetical protein
LRSPWDHSPIGVPLSIGYVCLGSQREILGASIFRLQYVGSTYESRRNRAVCVSPWRVTRESVAHTGGPERLLTQAGFKVRDLPEGHLCCGSAGTYNILEPEIALRLRDRKIANIVQTSPDLVATGNIGCIAQIASGTSIPVLHTVELLDFAHGGPTPDGLASLAG